MFYRREEEEKKHTLSYVADDQITDRGKRGGKGGGRDRSAFAGGEGGKGKKKAFFKQSLLFRP